MQTLPIPGPLSLGDLLDRAFRLYRANFRTLITLSAVFYIPYAMITGLLTGQTIGGYLGMLGALDAAATTPEDFGLDFGPAFAFFGATLLLSVVGVVVTGFVSLALTAQHLAHLRGESLSLGASVRAAGRRFWAWLGMNVVRVLAVIGVSLVASVLLICGGTAVVAVGGAGVSGLFTSGDVAPWAQGVAVAGTVVVFVVLYLVMIAIILLPVGYLFARWVAAVPGLLDQRWGAVESLRQSWRLTRGRFWRAFGYLALLSILSFIVVSMPQVVIQQLLTFVLLDNIGVAFGLSTAFSSLLTVLWQPLFTAAIVLLYFDLRVRSESYDLDLRVQQIEQAVHASAQESGGERLDQASGAENAPISHAA